MQTTTEAVRCIVDIVAVNAKERLDEIEGCIGKARSTTADLRR